MQLLVSDANILIDIEHGGLSAFMFSLAYQFIAPDVLFYEELEAHHAHLRDMGLQIYAFDERMVARVSAFAQQYQHPGRIDLFALVLALEVRCPLLTGDRALRNVAEQERIEVRGTLWLVTEMVRAGKITVDDARRAYQQMRVRGRRLPWNDAQQMLARLEAEWDR